MAQTFSGTVAHLVRRLLLIFTASTISLFTLFANPATAHQSLVAAQSQPCPPGTGPGGVHAGGNYAPQSLTQEQRQWLYQAFGHSGIAPDGYGGEPCGQNLPPTLPPGSGLGCDTPGTGPGGIRPGGYPATQLSQEQRDWLFHVFGHPGIAPDGYGGEFCQPVNGPGTNAQPQPPQQSQGDNFGQPVNPGGGNQPGSNAPLNRNVPFVPGIPSLSQAQQGNSGGVDVVTYCGAIGMKTAGSASDNTPNAANSWYCVDSNGSQHMLDWNQVCYYVYGDNYTATNTMGSDSISGWRCGQGSGNGNVNAPVSGQSGQTDTVGNQATNPNPKVCTPTGDDTIHVGMTVVVPLGGGATSVRDAPHSSHVLARMQEGEQSTVVGGPFKCLEATVWWQVTTGSSVTGWVVENYLGSIGIVAVAGSGLQPDFSSGSESDASASLITPLTVNIEGRDVPVVAFAIADIVKKTKEAETVQGLVLGPGFGVVCLGLGVAHSDDPGLQRAIDAGDITCTYISASAIVALTTTNPSAWTVFAGAAAIYPFVTNPDKYFGTVFQNEVYKWVMAKKVSCQFAAYALKVPTTSISGCQ